jgi:hypothetical protein
LIEFKLTFGLWPKLEMLLATLSLALAIDIGLRKEYCKTCQMDQFFLTLPDARRPRLL